MKTRGSLKVWSIGRAAAACLLLATHARAQGNPCEEYHGTGNGCTVPTAIVHAKGISGGIDFSGTRYDGTCSANGCDPACPGKQDQPLMRFWQHDSFATQSSRTAAQQEPGAAWMVNPNRESCDVRPESGVWIFSSADWANPGVEGCITGDRVVAEVSFCDSDAQSTARYAIASVADATSSFFDFDKIQGAGGADRNILPLTAVPVPVVQKWALNPLSLDFLVWVDLAAPMAWWTEGGYDDPAFPLVRGIEVLYQNTSVVPSPSCALGLGAWLPVLDPFDPARNLGPVPPGSGVLVNVPRPGCASSIWLSARVIYADASTACGPSDPCLAPQFQGTPASCFSGVAGPVKDCGDPTCDFCSCAFDCPPDCCLACPGRIQELKAVKRACDPTAPATLKVELSWLDDAEARGYKVYRTQDARMLWMPRVYGASWVGSCDDPAASALPWLYTVVGICSLGSDGPA